MGVAMFRQAYVALLLILPLYSCSDDHRAERLKAAGTNPTLEKLMTVADAKVGARLFRSCAACHTTSAGAPDTGGPNLHGIFGQPIGQHSSRFSYTAALRTKDGRWDEKALDAWIANPQQFVPGTKMQFSGVPDALSRADLIAYIRSLSD